MRKIAIIILSCSLHIGCSKQPMADFTWSPENPKVGEEVQFTNTSLNAKKFDWNLGNIKISSESNPKNIYLNDGDYIVDLIARTGLKSDVKTVTITISK